MRRLKKTIKHVFLTLLKSNKLYASALTIYSHILGGETKVVWKPNQERFQVSDRDGAYLVARKERLALYRHGVSKRFAFVYSSYGVPDSTIREGDIVIDCGANIGEFSIASERLGAVVHAFEPEYAEFSCLEQNLGKDSRAWNFALWRETSKLSFESRNETGYSRVTGEINPTESAQQVEGISLDDWAAQYLSTTDRIRLIKLEAEGGELEVMQGSAELLKRVDYIVADLGERGIDGDYPLAAVSNYLIKKGFDFLSYKKERGIGVYRSTKP